MAHVPHLHLSGPWNGPTIPLDTAKARHLATVLRRAAGADVSYTDGRGTVGNGSFDGHSVVRGPESIVPPAPAVTIAVAPPKQADRARFLVEKCAELGVAEVRWLTTDHGAGRLPTAAKAAAWTVAALEQSRGAHLMAVTGPASWPSDPSGWAIADPGGNGLPADVHTIAIGPEGGWGPDELPAAVPRVRVSDRILRTETAAVVAATLLIGSLAARD